MLTKSESKPMIGRLRISDKRGIPSTGAAGHGNFYRRFKTYFDVLLKSERVSEDKEKFNASYVNNSSIELEIRELIERDYGSVISLVGPKGVGKSTIIRYIFEEGNRPRIMNNDTLVLPIYLISTSDIRTTLNNLITNTIMSGSRILGDKYRVNMTDDNLYNFIYNTKPVLLEDYTIPFDSSAATRIQNLKKIDPYAYAVEALKYHIYQSKKRIKVLLIIDDMETKSAEYQVNIVKSIMLLRECMKNFGEFPNYLIFTCLFTCRPATLEVIGRRALDLGFPHISSVFISKASNFEKIIEKRIENSLLLFGDYLKNYTDHFSYDTEKNLKWCEDIENMNKFILRITNKYGEMILALSNQNLRYAIGVIRRIIECSHWYDGGHNMGAFDIRDYTEASEANIIRSAILGKNPYLGHNPSSPAEYTYANFLYNSESPLSDLIIVYIIRYFFQLAKIKKVNSVKLGKIKNILEICYDVKIIDLYIEEVIGYMRNAELIRTDKQESDTIADDIYIIPMEKLFFGWKLLSEISVFSEFCLHSTYISRNLYDDIFRNDEKVTKEEKMFLAISDFIADIANKEGEIIKRVKSKSFARIFIENFGDFVICEHMLKGLERSVGRYYAGSQKGEEKNDDSTYGMTKKYDEKSIVEGKIFDLRKMISLIKSNNLDLKRMSMKHKPNPKSWR